jgi:hypothetical protein
MKQRSPVAVFFLTLITFGIYGLVWCVKTKNELNQLGAQIPTAWLLLIPFVGFYWAWKYSEGVEKATGGEISGVLAFVLLCLLGVIGMAILQSEFNKLGGTPTIASPQPYGASAFGQPVNDPLPDNSFGGPEAPVQQTAIPVAFAASTESAAPSVVTPQVTTSAPAPVAPPAQRAVVSPQTVQPQVVAPMPGTQPAAAEGTPPAGPNQ